jgi:hypoxanthine phosphoribosyltransferase
VTLYFPEQNVLEFDMTEVVTPRIGSIIQGFDPDNQRQILLTKGNIDRRAGEIAAQLAANHRDDQNKLILACVLNGGRPWYEAIGRNLSKLGFPYIDDAIRPKSYAGTTSTDQVKILRDLTTDVAGRNIVLVEDIIDSGRTMFALLAMLRQREPTSIEVCTMLDKPLARAPSLALKPDYCGAIIEGKFVVGYGLDLDGEYRNLDGIYEVVTA